MKIADGQQIMVSQLKSTGPTTTVYCGPISLLQQSEIQLLTEYTVSTFNNGDKIYHFMFDDFLFYLEYVSHYFIPMSNLAQIRQKCNQWEN